MKVDKAVCTSPPLAPQRQLLGGGEEESNEEALDDSDQNHGYRIEVDSKRMDKTERYGVVLSTLMENKMQAIKRLSADNAAAKKKQHSPGRIALKFIPNCVRRNSLPESKVSHKEVDGDVEMGLIGVNCLSVDEVLAKKMDGPDQSEDEYMGVEVTSSQIKHQSDTLCDNTSMQSINSIGTAYSIPLAPANKYLSDARLRVLEAKSVSAQASPILPPKSLPHTTVTENLINAYPENYKPLNKSLVPTVSYRSSAMPTTTTTTSSSSHGGFISSFNELASSNNLSNLMNINLPVISSTISHVKKKVISSSTTVDSGTGQRPTVSTPLEYEQRTDRKWPYASPIDVLPGAITADSGSVGSGRHEWKTSRRKYRK